MDRGNALLFPDFTDRRVVVDDADLAVLEGGSGPAVLLLHGYPQTRATWHRIAPVLADQYRVIIPDLPGYGESRVTAALPGAGAKRRMAASLHAMMQTLGHENYIVIGHDRGGRVAYRMALDFPQSVKALVSVTVVPTPEMWEGANKAFGMGAWHWFMMAQPEPLPETLLAADPRFFIDHTLKKWRMACTGSIRMRLQIIALPSIIPPCGTQCAKTIAPVPPWMRPMISLIASRGGALPRRCCFSGKPDVAMAAGANPPISGVTGQMIFAVPE